MPWGILILVHAIGIPFVYGLGKKCGMKKIQTEIAAELQGE